MDKPRVLLVEDHPELRQTLAELLAPTWEVETADSAEAAWEHIEKNQSPDIILSDITMPGGSGLDLLQMVRSDDRTRLVPFILVSALSETDTVVQGLSLGANDYVNKPVNPAILEARMNTHLRSAQMQRQLEAQNTLLARLAAFDDLTGVYNRRAMTDALESEVTRSVRYRNPLALLVLDLDHFKRVNDTYGHPAGDEVLRSFVHRITPMLRSTDILCRYGGEEFCVIMPETAEISAVRAAERIRHVVEAAPFRVDNDRELQITVSIGLSCLPPGAEHHPEQLIDHADKALYAAKKGGRNRVQVYNEEECQNED